MVCGVEMGGAGVPPCVGFSQIRMRVWSDQGNPIGRGADAVGWPVLCSVARSFPSLLPLVDYSLNAISDELYEMVGYHKFYSNYQLRE